MMSNLTVDPQPDQITSDEPTINIQIHHNFPKAILLGIVLFLLLAITVYGAYWYNKNYLVAKEFASTTSNVPSETSQPKNSFSNLNNQSTPAATTDVTSDWQTFNSNDPGISFKYPKTAVVRMPQLSADFDIHNINNKYENSELRDGWVIGVVYMSNDPSVYSSKDRANTTLAMTKADGCQTTELKEFELDGKTTYYYEVKKCFGYNSAWYYVTGNKNHFEISLNYVGENEADYKKLGERIIKSIKFP